MKNIFFIGLISFFTDISSEMIYPLIPLYLTSTLGVAPLFIGIIEGLAESMTSLLKVYSGTLTDLFQKKKTLAFWGYFGGLVYKFALLFASTWGAVLASRMIDRMGKGIRTAPRDVLICDSAETKDYGTAFGLHKTLDMFGSSVGILFTFFLLSSVTQIEYKKIFLISAIPALLGLLMFVFVKEKRTERKSKPQENFWTKLHLLNPQLKLYLLVAFIFTLGNSSNAFLLLRAKSVGFSDSAVILLYLLYNLCAALLALPFGKMSDNIGRKKLLVSGYLIFAMVYFGFGLFSMQPVMIALFAMYGLYTALLTGVERAFIAEIAPQDLKGTLLGLHAALVGIALLPASVIAGVLFGSFGASVPFLFGGCLSLLAALLLIFFMKPLKAR